MSPFFIKAIQLLMSLSLLIVLHELGHFIPARIFKTRVEKFFLFFDVKFALFKKKIGDTTYGIGWLPLGGYVKISGMIDESMDTEQMKQPAQEWEFRAKPAWQRLIIMLGGVTVNLILGFLIYMMILFVWGKNTLTTEELPLGFQPSPVAQEIGFEEGDQLVSIDGKILDNVMDINRQLFLRPLKKITVKSASGGIRVINIPESIGQKMFESGEMRPLTPLLPALIDSISPNSPADISGLQYNDRLVSVNKISIVHWGDFQELMEEKKQLTLSIVIERDQIMQSIEINTPEGILGVYPRTDSIVYTNERLSLDESIIEGFDFGYWTLYDYVSQFQYMFTKKGAKQLGGFGAIGSMFPGTWNWKGFWSSTALISIILAFMNILPIPALDGGHVMFLTYEIVTGRKPNDKFMEYAQMFGFFLLLSLVLYANGNDLYRLLFN
ncbi:MAG: RIP metalloprotease RseP [Flavobacteriaceae bacterium]|jgi:regulator of sigma E protease|nr:RIP metalloprotease RseP [Flavobacteriaceae bacterium]